jgi:hypothetical protein
LSIIPCLIVLSRVYPCRAYSCLPVPTCALLFLLVPTCALSCCAYPYRVMRICAYSCRVVSSRACVVSCFMSWRAVLGPLNCACRAVSKIKKPVTPCLRTRHVTHVVPARIGTCVVLYRSRAILCRAVSCHTNTILEL